MPLYQNSVLKKYLKQQDKDAVTKAFKKFAKYFHDPKIQENIRSSKEEEFQGIFLTELFSKILGYTMKPNANFDLVAEYKNEKNSKKADGAILKDNQALGVIELKGTNTKDLEKVRQQAFDYKANQTGCVYVITSNFEKIRFYIDNAVDFEEFDLFSLNQERFDLLYLCLAKENILNNIPLRIKKASIQEEEAITKNFYADYSLFKRELFRDLVKLNMKNEVFRAELNNEDNDRETKNIKQALFKKSQKLIDRFLFIFFAEDRGLLPPNSALKILEQWNKLKDLDAYTPLYQRYQLYFTYLDQGRKGTEKTAEIFAYNGGLFKPDPVLDSLKISDQLLAKHTAALQAYDFESQVDVNILGHIFENSLNEIESVHAEIEGGDFDKQKSKRKKDGVFYTPKYITKYIVDNTVGKLCNEKKTELGVIEEEYFKSRKGRTKAKLKELLDSLEAYREWLLQITILDPACGSGAFLNQALDFLIKEHQYIDELQTNLLGGGFVFPDIENTVLENNIFGVDLNEESVEIAKLSLWLRTAQPRRKLNDLSSNIKCGNSLIDSKAVAGDKAFKWEDEYTQIFEKGGFDVVIGNPPYVIVFDLLVKGFLEDKYSVFKRNNDLYTAFYEKSITLIKENGILGFITPNSFVKGDYFKKLREYFTQYQINSIVDFTNFLVFEDANVFSAIIIISKNHSNEDWLLYSDLDKLKGIINSNSTSFIPENSIQKKLNELSDFEEHFLIKDVGFNYWSVGRGKVRGDSVGSRILYNGIIQNEKDIQYVKGSNFNRYTGISIDNYLRHNYNDYLNENDIFRYSPEILETTPKLIYRQTSNRLIGTIDYDSFYCDKTVHVIINRDNKSFDLHYVLGIFNSALLNYLYALSTEEKGRAFAQVKTVNIKKLPFKVASDEIQESISNSVKSALDVGKKYSVSNHKFSNYLLSKFSIEKLPRKLQNWHELEFGDFIKELNKAIKKAGGEKLSKIDEMEWMEVFETKKAEAQTLKDEIDKTDKEIDQMVYELYGLTEEEIQIVENN